MPVNTTGQNHVTATQLTASESTLVSSSSSERKFIGKMFVTNTHTANVDVTFWLLPTTTAGTTGAGGNYAVSVSIPPGPAITIYSLIGNWINESYKLSGQASVANVVNVYVSGNTET